MRNSHGPSNPELLAELDRDRPEPLYAQLEQTLREHIRSGRLAPGSRLPSTRALAADLGIARGVVAEAYAQLGAEGWLTARRGAGTTVAGRAREEPANRGSNLRTTGAANQRVEFDFDFGAPDLAAFPRRRWLAALRAALAEIPDAELGYGDPRGLVAARSEIARYLGRVRAVEADAERTLITSGTVQGIDIVCRTLRDRGARAVAVEDPGWAAQAATVKRAGLAPVAVPVDDAGIDVGRLAELDVDAALVTPAHQFPTGAVLGSERRHRLVAWAVERGALIVEDDYDAEYRYDRGAIGSVQGLAPDHVAYAGSASKTLAPALRLGWLVVPANLIASAIDQKHGTDRMTSPLTQLAFARFLACGDLDRHLRRNRLAYRRRRDALLAALARHLPQAELGGAAAGLHAVVQLAPDADEARIAADARARGIALTGLGELHLTTRPRRPGLVLGYAALPEERIASGIAALAEVVNRAGCAGTAARTP